MFQSTLRIIKKNVGNCLGNQNYYYFTCTGAARKHRVQKRLSCADKQKTEAVSEL